MDKQEQQKYIEENIGFILQEYREKNYGVKNPIMILHENKALVVKNLSEIGLRGQVKTRAKDAIRKGQAPLFYWDGVEFSQLWILNNG